MPEKKTYCPMPCRLIMALFIALSVAGCSGDRAALKKEDLFVPGESFKKANELIEKGYYEEARGILETIKIKDTSQSYGQLARLRIADTYFDDESYEEAVVEYQSFLDLYPQHKHASYAQYKLAMAFFRRVGKVDISYSWAQRALEEFEKLQRLYPRNPYMDIIDSRIAACRSILAEYEYYVGSFYYRKSSYRAAIGRFEGILKDYPDSGKVPEALYYIGLAYNNLGQKDEAIDNLSALIKQYPSVELSGKARRLIGSLRERPSLIIEK